MPLFTVPSTKTTPLSYQLSRRRVKRYGVLKWAEMRENPLTIFTSRRDRCGQYVERAKEMCLSFLSLPAFQHDCETMGDDLHVERGERSLSVGNLRGRNPQKRLPILRSATTLPTTRDVPIRGGGSSAPRTTTCRLGTTSKLIIESIWKVATLLSTSFLVTRTFWNRHTTKRRERSATI